MDDIDSLIENLDKNTDLLREHQIEQQVALMAGLDHRFPKEGAQQA